MLSRVHLGICLVQVLAFSAFGFSTDGSTVVRSFDNTTAFTNGAITISSTFTNRGTNDLHGFVFSEEIPSALVVTPLQVSLNGQAVTNCLIEAGQDGDVYPLYTPYRWILERPTLFAEANRVPVAGTVRIVYAVSSASSGTYTLQNFSWEAVHAADTNVEFGCSEPTDQQAVSFIQASTPILANVESTASGFSFRVTAPVGLSYAVERSTNLRDWYAVVTNTAPFTFTDTSSPAAGYSLYRAVWVP